MIYLNEKENIEIFECNLYLNSGNLDINFIKNKEYLIFDYTSNFKVFNRLKIKNKKLNFVLFENPVFKIYKTKDSTWKLGLNESINTDLKIHSKAVNAYIDLKNILIEKFLMKTESSRVEIFLPDRETISFYEFEVKNSIFDIYIPEGYYCEINLNLNQSISNISETKFKEKKKNYFYYNGGEKGKFYLKIIGKNVNINFHIKE